MSSSHPVPVPVPDPTSPPPPAPNRTLGYLVVGAVLAWCVARAVRQSVTFDEAVTYTKFVAGGPDLIRHQFDANNHTLHSLLAWVSTGVLGLSELTLRLPALLGSLVFLLASAAWSRRLSSSRALRPLVLLTLVASPFVLDYLVAARGYSLALGLLMTALLVGRGALGHGAVRDGERRALARFALLGLLCALSVASNLAFAFANLGLLLVVATWATADLLWSRSRWRLVALARLASMIVPGAVVFLAVNPAVLASTRTGLWFGATGWGESLGSLVGAAFDDWAPGLVGPSWRPALALLCQASLLLLLALSLVAAALVIVPRLLRRRREGPVEPETRSWLFCLSVLAVTVALHQAANALAGLPLPLERTGLFMVPLAGLLLAASVELLDGSPARRVARVAGRGALLVVVLYFAACLRGNYFRVWRWDAGARELYRETVAVCADHGLDRFGGDWLLKPSFVFYQRLAGRTDGPLFQIEPGWQHRLYLARLRSDPVIVELGLTVVYEHPVSGAVLAVSDEVVRTSGS